MSVLFALMIPVGLTMIIYGLSRYNDEPFESGRYRISEYRHGRLAEQSTRTGSELNTGHKYGMQVLILFGGIFVVAGFAYRILLMRRPRLKAKTIPEVDSEENKTVKCFYCGKEGKCFVCSQCKASKLAVLSFKDQSDECTVCGAWYNNGHYDVCEKCGSSSFKAI